MNYKNDNNILELLTDKPILTQPTIRPLRHLAELHEVYRLTHKTYVNAGYFKSHPSNLLIHYPYFDHIPETTVLVAYLHGKIVGSISYTLDGPSGLTVDEDFKAECDGLRGQGKSIAVVWRLVIEESVRDNRTVVMNLIEEVTDRIIEAKCDTYLFSVNPKHERAYKRMLNMEVAGTKPETGGLNQAPAVLLSGNVQDVVQSRRLKHSPVIQMLLAANY